MSITETLFQRNHKGALQETEQLWGFATHGAPTEATPPGKLDPRALLLILLVATPPSPAPPTGSGSSRAEGEQVATPPTFANPKRKWK